MKDEIKAIERIIDTVEEELKEDVLENYSHNLGVLTYFYKRIREIVKGVSYDTRINK